MTDAQPPENRSFGRRLGRRIHFWRGGTQRCRVFNMSEDGAGVELPTKLHVRETFKMMLEKDRTIRHCRLVWSSDTRIGVVFKAD
jgi:hypothetical protein